MSASGNADRSSSEALQRDRREHEQRDGHRRPAPPQQRERDGDGGERRHRAVGHGEFRGAAEQHGRRERTIGDHAGEPAPSRRRRRRRGLRRVLADPCQRIRVVGRARRGTVVVAAQDPQDAAHVGERVARGRGDAAQERVRGGVVADGEPRRQLVRLARDPPQPAGDGGLQVRRDADALLLRGLADVAVAVADEPPVALAQALLQLRLPADPAPDEDRQAHRDEGERRVGRALDARIEDHARCRHGDDGGRQHGEPAERVDPAPGDVERDEQRDQRRHDMADEHAVERALRRQHDRARDQRQEREPPPPGQRERQQRAGRAR